MAIPKIIMRPPDVICYILLIQYFNRQKVAMGMTCRSSIYTRKNLLQGWRVLFDTLRRLDKKKLRYIICFSAVASVNKLLEINEF